MENKVNIPFGTPLLPFPVMSIGGFHFTLYLRSIAKGRAEILSQQNYIIVYIVYRCFGETSHTVVCFKIN